MIIFLFSCIFFLLSSSKICHVVIFSWWFWDQPWPRPSASHRPVTQRPLQLREWGSGRRLRRVAMHPSPIYLAIGGDSGPPAALPAGIQTLFQASKPKPLPSLSPNWDQEEEHQTSTHAAQHQVLQSDLHSPWKHFKSTHSFTVKLQMTDFWIIYIIRMLYNSRHRSRILEKVANCVNCVKHRNPGMERFTTQSFY